jgi:hypothetical protein
VDTSKIPEYWAEARRRILIIRPQFADSLLSVDRANSLMAATEHVFHAEGCEGVSGHGFLEPHGICVFGFTDPFSGAIHAVNTSPHVIIHEAGHRLWLSIEWPNEADRTCGGIPTGYYFEHGGPCDPTG